MAFDHDGVVGRQIEVEDGVAHVRRVQPSRTKILELNKQLRNNPAALKSLSFAGWELSIPEVDYRMWLELIPDLGSHDKKTKMNAWKAFMASDLADPYRVRERKKRGRS